MSRARRQESLEGHTNTELDTVKIRGWKLRQFEGPSLRKSTFQCNTLSEPQKGSLCVRGPDAEAAETGWCHIAWGESGGEMRFCPTSDELVSIALLFPCWRDHRRSLLAWDISWLSANTVKSRKSWTEKDWKICFVLCFKGISGTPAKQPRKSEPTETKRSFLSPNSQSDYRWERPYNTGKWLRKAFAGLPSFLSFACSPQKTRDSTKWAIGAK